MTEIYVVPGEGHFPERGGVREHLIQLHRHIRDHHSLELATDSGNADIYHVESSFYYPDPDVYVCHGGFVPNPLGSVLRCLNEAKVVVSVASWIVHKYFPEHAHKTIVIPNGVSLDEWRDIPYGESGIKPGYVLYAKEWSYYLGTFRDLAIAMPDVRFVTVVWQAGWAIPDNVTVIGLKSRERIRPYVKDAGALILTGSEVCPTMMLEAWACKTPVVGFLTDGVRELYSWGLSEDSEGRVFVDGGVPFVSTKIEDMAEVIRRTLISADFYGHLGYLKVLKHFQWVDLICRYADIYEAILDDRVEILCKTWSEASRKAAGRPLGIWPELVGATRESTSA